MYPILLEWGSIIIPAWHTFFALGAVASYFLLIVLSRKYFPQLSEVYIGWLFAFTYVGGYVGARFLSTVIDQPELNLWEKLFALFELGPMTFYGGFLGAILAGIGIARILKLPFRDIADMALLCGILGLAIGRVGCFLNGDDYGIPIAIDQGNSIPWWAVTFPNHSDPIPRVPVQLFEASIASVIVLIGLKFFGSLRSVLFPGAVGVLVTVSYAIARFFLEYLRGDPRGSILGGILSPSQFISILIVVAANILFIVELRRYHCPGTSGQKNIKDFE